MCKNIVLTLLIFLICFNIFFQACHIWKLIPTIYEAFIEEKGNPIWPDWLNIIKDISHVLVVFNSAINFLLYLVL